MMTRRGRTGVLSGGLGLALGLMLAAELGCDAWVASARAADESTGISRQQAAAGALTRGELKQAIQLYTDALTDPSLANDRRASILSDRAVAYGRAGDIAKAFDDFNHALQLYPELASIYNNRGNLLLSMGQSREAIRDFDRALALSPGYGAAYANRAVAEMELGLGPDAERDLSRAIPLSPQSGAALASRGSIFARRGRPYLALRDLNRAVSLDAKLPAAYRARAEALIMLERYDDAIKDLSRAIAFAPDSVEDYLLRGRAYLLADKAPSAVKDFSRAFELKPSSTDALEARGLAEIMAGSPDEAEVDLAKAIELDPRSAVAYAYRGLVYAKLGQLDVGAKEIEKAVHIDANKPDVLWAKAELAMSAGRLDEARADLRKARDASPNDPRIKISLAKLGRDQRQDDIELPGRGVGSWRVVQRGKRYYALSPDFSSLSIPLEMIGDGLPRLIEWDVKKAPIKGIATLRYASGDVADATGALASESVVLVDLVEDSVIAIEPHKLGDKVSKWDWDEGRFKVASYDGASDEIVLKGSRSLVGGEDSRRVAGRPGEDGRGAASGEWPTWGQQKPARERSASSPQRARPKTLLELLFGN